MLFRSKVRVPFSRVFFFLAPLCFFFFIPRDVFDSFGLGGGAKSCGFQLPSLLALLTLLDLLFTLLALIDARARDLG